jgi:hypothetical protein
MCKELGGPVPGEGDSTGHRPGPCLRGQQPTRLADHYCAFDPDPIAIAVSFYSCGVG